MGLSSYAQDKFVAPYMSSFTSADIEDLSALDPQQEHWLTNFILNTVLRVRIEDPTRAYLFNFLRRTEAALRQYHLAREATYSYLENKASVSRYVAANFHWEVALAQTWLACELLIKLTQENIFQKQDGSPEQRLNKLHNESKHLASVIKVDNLPYEDATLGLWLENAGIRSNDAYLGFGEFAAVLRDLASCASLLQNPATLTAPDPSPD